MFIRVYKCRKTINHFFTLPTPYKMFNKKKISKVLIQRLKVDTLSFIKFTLVVLTYYNIKKNL